MALIKCPECGKEISSFAEMCPNCGCPKSRIEEMSAQTSNDPKADFKEGMKIIANDENKGLCLLERAANNGYSDAYNELGFHCLKKKDYKQAFYWWEKGIELGNILCLMNVAVCYVKGEGVEKSIKKGIEYYEKAAELGSGESCARIAVFYLYGCNNFEASPEKGVYWAQKGVKLCDANSHMFLGFAYLYGLGVEKSIPKAIEFLEFAAKQNVGRAQMVLGMLYSSSQEQRTRGKYLLMKALKSNFRDSAIGELLKSYSDLLSLDDLVEMGLAEKRVIKN